MLFALHRGHDDDVGVVFYSTLCKRALSDWTVISVVPLSYTHTVNTHCSSPDERADAGEHSPRSPMSRLRNTGRAPIVILVVVVPSPSALSASSASCTRSAVGPPVGRGRRPTARTAGEGGAPIDTHAPQTPPTRVRRHCCTHLEASCAAPGPPYNPFNPCLEYIFVGRVRVW